MNVSQVLNANVYIDGTNNLIGRAGTITLPDVVAAVESHRGLGMIGSIEIPTGLDLLTTKIKWNGFYPDALKLGANPFASHKLQVRASIETFGAGGRESEVPLIVSLVCTWKKSPLGAFSPGAKVEAEQELSTTYVKVNVDGKDTIEIDILENVWKVDGVDVLATYRANLGGK
jgi:P2 family phage contractile tail tube protein